MKTKTLIAGMIMTSVLTPFAAFAQSNTKATSAPKKTDFSCVQIATDKREDGIASAWTTYSTSVSSALLARKTALHNAWEVGTAKDRQAARNVAWNAYRTSLKTAKTNLQASRNAAWNTFSADAKACKITVPGENKTSDNL